MQLHLDSVLEIYRFKEKKKKKQPKTHVMFLTKGLHSACCIKEKRARGGSQQRNSSHTRGFTPVTAQESPKEK